MNNRLEEIEKEIEKKFKKREKKRKPEMKVKGKRIYELKKIISGRG
jgi:hypothetical protein